MARMIEKLRAWWWHKQGLDGRLARASPGEVLAQTGWARSVGGVGPYLTLFSRAGTSREAADAAAARLEIYELPAARGCTYVVPATDFALALKAGESFTQNEMKVAGKLGVTEKEIDKLCAAVLKALAKGPLDPEQIREATGSASRSLGEEGKKKGLTTTLPLALGNLQSSGEIRRVSISGRFDQQRYRYALWNPNPAAGFKLPVEEVQTELARRFFSWAGPATLGEFQAFSALGVKASQTAIAPLKLEAIDGDRMLLAEDRAKFEAFKVPKQPQYALVSPIDAIVLLRSDPASIVDPDAMKKIAGAEKRGVINLPNPAIVDRGRVVGLWEYDPEKESIAWLPFIARNKDLESAVARTEEFVRGQLGDARSFSLDSPKSRAPRIQALRKAAARC